MPVSAAVGRAEVLGALKYGEGSDTWSANPLSSAAVLATLDEFETTDVIGRGRQLAAVIETGLLRLVETGVIARVRGEGAVWGIECAAIGSHSAEQVAVECVRSCYLGDGQGRAIHLLGPLAGKVSRWRWAMPHSTSWACNADRISARAADSIASSPVPRSDRPGGLSGST